MSDNRSDSQHARAATTCQFSGASSCHAARSDARLVRATNEREISHTRILCLGETRSAKIDVFLHAHVGECKEPVPLDNKPHANLVN